MENKKNENEKNLFFACFFFLWPFFEGYSHFCGFVRAKRGLEIKKKLMFFCVPLNNCGTQLPERQHTAVLCDSPA